MDDDKVPLLSWALDNAKWIVLIGLPTGAFCLLFWLMKELSK